MYSAATSWSLGKQNCLIRAQSFCCNAFSEMPANCNNNSDEELHGTMLRHAGIGCDMLV